MTSARDFVPAGADLDRLREAAAGCRGCGLYQDATQTVFGRGDADAEVVMVGEQPGDMEDKRGLPFVGPAGHLLRRAVDDAGIDPGKLYITNAVAKFAVYVRPWNARSAVNLRHPRGRVAPYRSRGGRAELGGHRRHRRSR
jgi:uracil-DNA glycosylase